jgi:hypothetical protein
LPGGLAGNPENDYLKYPSDSTAVRDCFEVIMFAFFRRRRRARRYVWTPAVDFSDRRIAATLMLFSAN